MNAQLPAPSALTVVALQNVDILRAFAAGPLADLKAVAAGSGRDSKNLARQLDLLHRDGLVTRDKPFDLTDAGRRALHAIDVANGAAPAGEGASDVMMLAHHQLRPNPLQPRKRIDEAELEALAATIHDAGDVLQNLVVFPPDSEGVHDIAAGERRWRAVGLLIERGLWPADRRLRAIERERSAGQVSYLALVENGQRANLSLIEEARAYAELIAETGWSAREAALRTGRDPRTVQEMTKVLREASPEDIALHEAGGPDHTWEWLRNAVKAPKPAEPEPHQIDVEEVTEEPAWKSKAERFSPEVVAAALANETDPRTTNPKMSGGTTIEGETWPAELTEVLRTPWQGYPGAEIELTESSLGRWAVAISTQQGAPNYSGSSEPPYVYAGSLLFRSRADALEYAEARIVKQLGDWARKRVLQNWLAEIRTGQFAAPADDDPLVVNGRRFPNLTRANEARRILAGGGPRNSGGGRHEPDPAPIPAPAQAQPVELKPLEHLAMLELAMKLANGDDAYGGLVSGEAWTKVRKYWLDTTCTRLVNELRLVKISHTFPEGPHATLTEQGQAWADEQDLTDEALEDANEAAGWPRQLIAEYRTPWLNVTDEPASAAPAPQDPDADEPVYDDGEAGVAREALYDISAAIDSHDDFDRPTAFARAGITLPLSAGKDDELGVIFDGAGHAILTVDSDGQVHPDLVAARVLLIMTALNAAAIEWESHGEEGVQFADGQEPAVPIRRSITVDHIVCLEDGRKFKSLRRHLLTRYNLTPDEYRAKWGLPLDYPMVAPNYAQARYNLARALLVDRPPSEDDE